MIDSIIGQQRVTRGGNPHLASHDHDGTDDGGEVRIKGTLRQRQLARALRRLREDAGLSIEEAAPKLDWSTSKLGRIETAEQSVDVRSMLDLYAWVALNGPRSST